MDKGWSWVMMFSAMGVHFSCGGLQYTAGFMRFLLLEKSEENDKSSITWIASMYCGFINAIAPCASFILYKIGCRKTVMIGATLETLGFLCSFLYGKTWIYFVFYSFLAGSGSGITYISLLALLSYNFERYLSLASGIAVSGQGIGVILMPIIIEFFSKSFGLQGTFLLFGAITLQKFVLGALMRPSSLELDQIYKFSNSGRSRKQSPPNGGSVDLNKDASLDAKEELKNNQQTFSFGCLPYFDKKKVPLKTGRKKRTPSIFVSEIQYDNMAFDCEKGYQNTMREEKEEEVVGKMEGEEKNEEEKENERKEEEKEERKEESKEEEEEKEERKEEEKEERKEERKEEGKEEERKEEEKEERKEERKEEEEERKEENEEEEKEEERKEERKKEEERKEEEKEKEEEEKEEERKESQNSSKIRKRSIDLRNLETKNIRKCSLTGNTMTDKPDAELEILTLKESNKTKPEFNKNALEATTCDNISEFEQMNPFFAILKIPRFLFFLVAITFFSIPEETIYMMFPKYTVDNGASEDEMSYLLSILGISSTLTRVLTGILAHSNILNIFLLSSLMFGMSGLATLFLPFYVFDSSARILYVLCFGFTNCHIYSLLNEMVLQIVGIDNSTAAIGLLVFIKGLCGIFGPPFADAIANLAENPDVVFYFAGIIFLICSASFLAMRFTMKTKNQ